ncbi:hypothetical protein ATANTOWER_023792, partial [Ataeniobius toweri]|nr:hypothetical protein [Ataeniobius toweri]
IADPRKPHSRSWIVHHNRLKPYKGTLQSNGQTLLPGFDDTPFPGPSLTALSGALPFRPPDSPRVPSRIVQPPFTTSAVETTPQGAFSPPCSSDSPTSPEGSVPASPSPVARPVVSRSGRMIRQPLKYKDFVT